ncbi:GIY-YIG nuclease family protein [Singulisphaera rosea]
MESEKRFTARWPARFELLGDGEKAGVYHIRCLKNDRVYIGQTDDIFVRWRSHISMLWSGVHSNKPLQDDYNLYGQNSFLFSLVKASECHEERQRLEASQIEKMIDAGVAYNLQLRSPAKKRRKSAPPEDVIAPTELKPIVAAWGSPEKFAAMLEVSPRSVYYWLAGTRCISKPKSRLIRMLTPPAA